MTSNDIISQLYKNYPILKESENEIYNAYKTLNGCYSNGGKVLVCGNGGSAADADHIVGELMKGFLLSRKINDTALNGDDEILTHLQGALPAVSLSSHSALLTAFANDIEFEYAYAQQVYGLGNSGDVLIALSTSGNSASVANAVRAAGAKGVISIGITGSKDSLLNKLCDVCIRLPETETFRIQELTLPVYHCLCAMLEADFFVS